MEIGIILILVIIAWNLKAGIERLENKLEEIQNELKELKNKQKERSQ